MGQAAKATFLAVGVGVVAGGGCLERRVMYTAATASKLLASLLSTSWVIVNFS